MKLLNTYFHTHHSLKEIATYMEYRSKLYVLVKYDILRRSFVSNTNLESNNYFNRIERVNK